jgi:hypothetical protein
VIGIEVDPDRVATDRGNLRPRGLSLPGSHQVPTALGGLEEDLIRDGPDSELGLPIGRAVGELDPGLENVVLVIG